ncbi:MAG: hypothetical protein KME60_07130 [Cyanomargarita calcarea GSE-NOS-MK-12-04C]|jgi:hypothetical protein|uniref:Uncharacterized protein n=1 Tax=Cyanomargarita calcarea GSE-NOS-MK-12-04C TaxID=2839659 RepID=A0A951QLL1_9CYAN|nr:hypothetical protein [Cyanomargarita calcarea GSE-NOS-MK-12-04C]
MANQLVLSNWHKAYIAGGCAVSMWLASQAPIGKVGKGVFLSLSLLHSVALVRIAKPLIFEEASAIARLMMDKEVKNTELLLQTKQLESEMEQVYATSDVTSDTEVINELKDSLEALWDAVATNPTSDLQASTNRKSLYLAAVSLLKNGKSETFLIEEVFGCSGRNFQNGKKLLQELLHEGEENKW